MPKKVVGGGIGAIGLILLVMLLGGDPTDIMNTIQVGDQGTTSTAQGTAQDELSQFVSVVLADAEDVWTLFFQNAGQHYRKPKLVLYNDAVQSACGYCPGDERIYIDLVFYRQLQTQFKAPGDFAMAYVIAHEVGHHVQKLFGITEQVMSMRGRVSQKEFNQYMIRLELQADFYAGVWAHHAQRINNILEEGDIEEAMNAASAVGDDRIQRRTQGYVVPDAFTHGTSEQRKSWFLKGFKTGDMNQGNTFGERYL
jgi:predicted metalloprotease